MRLFRSLICLFASALLIAGPGCAPTDPGSRIESALEVLQSDAGGARKARACTDLQAALAVHPSGAADRDTLNARAVPLLIRALADPLSRVAAQKTLVSIGIASYEPLFDAVLEADPITQYAAVTCLIGMSDTAVPVLLPALLGPDIAAQERASRVLIHIGKPIASTLRMYYTQVLEPFGSSMGPDTADEGSKLSRRGAESVLAFARVFGGIGDETSILALMDGCETLRRNYPHVAAEHLRIIERLGPDALKALSRPHLLNYDRLKLMVQLRLEDG